MTATPDDVAGVAGHWTRRRSDAFDTEAVDPVLAQVWNGTSVEDWREFFDERAAIFEFLGGAPRAVAEAKARQLAGPEPRPSAPARSSVPAMSPRQPPARGQHEDTSGNRCRSCGAAITWALAVKDGRVGKAAPWQVDLRGEWAISRAVIVGRSGTQVVAQHAGPAATQLELGAAPSSQEQRYSSHFATCPDAKRWRTA